jgi:replicative DNA helicase
MCDGHVTKRGALELTLASERMVRQHQHLLLRFGIQSRVVYKKALCAGAAFDAWRLCVYVRGNSQFLKEIPLWGEKRLRLEAGVVGKEERETIGMPCVSEAFRDTLREQITAKQLLGMRLASVSRNLGWDCKFYFEQLFAVGTKGRQIHLSRFKELCRVFGLTEQYAWLWGSDLFWDPIVSIRSAGERKIYDLSVLPTHCFIANDIVVHNTWMLLLMLIHAYRTGKKVLVVTTEMSQVRIIIRTLAMYLGLPFGTLRKGKLNDTQEAEFYEGVALLSVAENRFWVVGGDFDFKIDSLALAIEEVKPDIVGVDGAYLLKTSGKDRFDQAATAFNELKRMAKFKNVPILASMQFNREAKKGAIASVQMQNIAMTDVASWNADLCLALHQDEDMKKDKRMVMRWLKARDTFIPDMEINWDIENGNFEELLSEEEVATQAEQAATDGAPALDLTEDAELPF